MVKNYNKRGEEINPEEIDITQQIQEFIRRKRNVQTDSFIPDILGIGNHSSKSDRNLH